MKKISLICTLFYQLSLFGLISPSRAHTFRLAKNFCPQTSITIVETDLAMATPSLMNRSIQDRPLAFRSNLIHSDLKAEALFSVSAQLGLSESQSLSLQPNKTEELPFFIQVSKKQDPISLSKTALCLETPKKPTDASQKQQQTILSKTLLCLPRFLMSSRIAVYVPQGLHKLTDWLEPGKKQSVKPPSPPVEIQLKKMPETEPLFQNSLSLTESFNSLPQTPFPILTKKLEQPDPVFNDWTPVEAADAPNSVKGEEVPDFIQLRLFELFKKPDTSVHTIQSKSNSTLSTAGNRLANEQLKRVDQMIDEFNSLDLTGDNISTQFTAKGVISPLGRNGGYGVEVELSLQERFRPIVIDQDLIFVIDATKNTTRSHFKQYKAGILRSLKSLSPDTKFNIIVIGKRVEKLFDHAMSATNTKLLIAKRFLDQVQSQQPILKTSLIQALTSLVPTVEETPLMTLILLTDALFTKKQPNFSQELKTFIQKNQGNFSLVAASLETPHREQLKFLSLMAHGEYTEFSSESSFVRKFSSMVRTLKYPYMTHLKITALKDGVQIYPSETLSTPLYINKPYRFGATTASCESFEVFIQGLLDGSPVHIRKQINLTINESARAKIKSQIEDKKIAEALEAFIRHPETAQAESPNFGPF